MIYHSDFISHDHYALLKVVKVMFVENERMTVGLKHL